jgi:hypothetical protein
MNPESVVVLAHGLRLVVSTLWEEDQAFRAASSGQCWGGAAASLAGYFRRV